MWVIKNCGEEIGFTKGPNPTDLINHKERTENGKRILEKNLKAVATFEVDRTPNHSLKVTCSSYKLGRNLL
jgi:hypothetical protein